jgi:hypothetical protein
MSYIINYSSGGLGNRLIPLSCVIEFANKTNREVGIIWPKTLRCMANFNSLFDNNFKFFEIPNLDPTDTVIYSQREFIEHDANLNNNIDLLELSKKCDFKSLNLMSHLEKENKKNIIIYHNTSFISDELISNQLKQLKPTKYVLSEVDDFCKKNLIDSNVVGIHARSTDFVNSNLSDYTDKIINSIKNNSQIKILFCSDNVNWERHVKISFPNNIIIREKKSFVEKHDIHRSWINNVLTTEESVVEGLIDIYLLSKTNFLHYNPESTFAKIVKLLKL